MDQISTLKQWIDEAECVVFFGGAGVSTESGVPDFRSATGIYAEVQGAEEILTPGFLRRHPKAFYDFYRKYFILDDSIRPNAAHLALAELEQLGKMQAIITQNIDGLHQKAGSGHVIELHGTAERFTCRACGHIYDVEHVKGMRHVPQCACGEILRSDIIMYEEKLDPATIEEAVYWIEQADLLIIGGTSLVVYPAAGFIRYQKPGGKKVLINLEPSHTRVDLQINQPIGQVFRSLMQLYEDRQV